ncbi:type-F conjugative transfer system secretin TraK (plasmid) [Xanthomonas citri pv. citri]|uniref:TraK domain-containing protein n=1 Tax=Xanthomonas citri TaxID=346 RepID=UPI001934494E|nr:type-F conjugative transfer system secretin TraK [Xanthomonas citri]QRD62632.1 type-F conjugative transfer system secretin TraK [Xanthomonas citri pv. citri]QRD67167.1 type-F conjugative transfer system secretin TraK [Xanthomonas citri pv. citri]QRD71788.1 type-F conjugative transfer system secretin TraK [Xanthomonas citri pv. citri]
MKLNYRIASVAIAACVLAGNAGAQVLAPQDMKPGAAAVETAGSLPGSRPIASTAEPTVVEQGGGSAVPQARAQPLADAAQLQNMEVRAAGAVGQIPVRPKKLLPPPPPQVDVDAGVNKAFGIALQHLNQIVTPFRDPEIKTTSVASISVEKGVVYVSTMLGDEIALLIYEKGGDPASSMSLTLVPDAINPVSVKVNLRGYHPGDGLGSAVASTEAARGWEMDQPFLEMVKSTFRELALGRVPDGYGFQPIRRVPAEMPHCSFPGFEIEPLQLVTGSSMVVIVSRLTNRNHTAQQVDESSCVSERLVGATTWPSAKLQPGKSAELYLAVRQVVDKSSNQRPSVVGSGTADR